MISPPVTPETLTDEMIRVVRETAARDLETEQQWWRDNRRHGWSTTAMQIHEQRERDAREIIAIVASAMNQLCHPPRRAEARLRICDVINARSKP